MATITGKSVVRSAIATSYHDRIVVRGLDLAEQLIGQMSFADYFHFLVTGRQADAATSAVLNAALVSIAEHALVPSVQAARMTLASAPDAMQGAVAAGILGCGSVILGASHNAGLMFQAVQTQVDDKGLSLRDAALAVVADLRARKQAIAGYGHPEHKERDPRVNALFAVSARVGASERFIEIAQAIERVIPDVLGKPLKLNVSGAIPAVLLGVDFPVAALKGVPMLARTASLIAHMTEEASDPIGFALAIKASSEYVYTGPDAGQIAGAQ